MVITSFDEIFEVIKIPTWILKFDKISKFCNYKETSYVRGFLFH